MIGKRIRRWVENILVFCVFTLLFYSLNYVEVSAEITGKGTRDKPYVVSNSEDLEYALTEGKRSSGYTYVAVAEKIKIKKKIDVEGGSFFIYAYKSGAHITKSKSDDASINNSKNPTYCIRVGMKETTYVEIGCSGNEIIELSGEREHYENNKKISSGWLYVGEKGNVKLGNKAYVKNMINNDPNSQLSNLTVFGTLSVDCTIKNCKSKNGGAICAKNEGVVEICQNAYISECYSESEGGGLWIKDSATLNMFGGSVTGNVSVEEGGGIFLSGKGASANIINGFILNNESSQSAGGIFSGYGATLVIGQTGVEDGPLIDGNVSGGSGGGIRPNGGTGDNAGGRFYFYGGTVSNNVSGKHGGGIGIGAPGSKGEGIVNIENANVINNTAAKNGGGIYVSEGNKGINTVIQISNCNVNKNKSSANGGGIQNNSPMELKNGRLEENMATQNGGGLYIGSKGSVTSELGHIGGNSSGGNGNGIYLNGLLSIGGDFVIGNNDVIYLCENKYVEIYKRFDYKSNVYMSLGSERKSNGTKLVHVTYKDGTGEKLLYGNDRGEEEEYSYEDIPKTIKYQNKTGKMMVRSAGNIKDIGTEWIIISEKYYIRYSSDFLNEIKGMPKTQLKFYNEETTIYGSLPDREGYEADMSRSWNTDSAGQGQVYLPGSKYEKNEDITLYIFWKKLLKISIKASDRYYMVGQDIVLNNGEVLKKVAAYDNTGTNYNYNILVIRIEDCLSKTVMFKDDRGVEENMMEKLLSTSKAGRYKLTLYTRNKEENKENTATMEIYVLENLLHIRQIRFISKQYMYTLNPNSLWYQGVKNKMLLHSLEESKIAHCKLTPKEIQDIKVGLRNNNYEENSENNKEFYSQFIEGGK